MENTEQIARESFVFHKDWWIMLRSLPDDLRLKAHDAVAAYAFAGEVPDDQIINSLTTLIRLTIERKSRKRPKKVKPTDEPAETLPPETEQSSEDNQSYQPQSTDHTVENMPAEAHDNVEITQPEIIPSQKETVLKEKIQKAERVINEFYKDEWTVQRILKRHRGATKEHLDITVNEVKKDWLEHDGSAISLFHLKRAIDLKIINAIQRSNDPVNKRPSRP
ncbi:MAG: DUF6291 domain-containing protein [Bacteroides sp.]|nr:DUF6291 domain-containing protein [Bacteroides sp.]MCM1413096.1 DUF6291 domain-containing protein [Bacteroides sp.]MCM1472162.1 DUF6291 domain-containing protein [Bacteroides sp.]